MRSFHGRVDAAFRNAAWQITLEADVVASKEHQGVRRSAYGFGLTENAIAIHLGCQQGGKSRGVNCADHVVDDDGRTAFHQRCEQTFAGLFEVVRMRRDDGLAATDGRHHVSEQGLAASLSRGVEGEGRRRWQQRAHHGRQDRGKEHGVVHWASQRKQAHGLPDSLEGLSNFGKRRMSGHRKRDRRQCGKKLLVLVVPVFVDQCARDRVNDGRGHHGLQCRKAARKTFEKVLGEPRRDVGRLPRRIGALLEANRAIDDGEDFVLVQALRLPFVGQRDQGFTTQKDIFLTAS